MKESANRTVAHDVLNLIGSNFILKLLKAILDGISYNQNFTTTEKLAKELSVGLVHIQKVFLKVELGDEFDNIIMTDGPSQIFKPSAEESYRFQGITQSWRAIKCQKII
jgi:hypothetical protein